MKRKHIIILLLTVILAALVAVPFSCSHRYMYNSPTKVTKGYNKPPKAWKQPKSRYPSSYKRHRDDD